MEKKDLIEIIEKRRLGVYKAILIVYKPLFKTAKLPTAQYLIEKDLSEIAGRKITINENSLKRAVQRLRKEKRKTRALKTKTNSGDGKTIDQRPSTETPIHNPGKKSIENKKPAKKESPDSFQDTGYSDFSPDVAKVLAEYGVKDKWQEPRKDALPDL